MSHPFESKCKEEKRRTYLKNQVSWKYVQLIAKQPAPAEEPEHQVLYKTVFLHAHLCASVYILKYKGKNIFLH